MLNLPIGHAQKLSVQVVPITTFSCEIDLCNPDHSQNRNITILNHPLAQAVVSLPGSLLLVDVSFAAPQPIAPALSHPLTSSLG